MCSPRSWAFSATRMGGEWRAQKKKAMEVKEEVQWRDHRFTELKQAVSMSLERTCTSRMSLESLTQPKPKYFLFSMELRVRTLIWVHSFLRSVIFFVFFFLRLMPLASTIVQRPSSCQSRGCQVDRRICLFFGADRRWALSSGYA